MIGWINNWKNYFQNDYDYICSKVGDMKKFSFEDYKYCVIMSNSRTFKLRIDGRDTQAMCPLLDMLNHK